MLTNDLCTDLCGEQITVVTTLRLRVGGRAVDVRQRDVEEAQVHGQLAAVVMPEFIPAKWWQSLLHNQTAWLIKAALLYRRRHLGFQRVIIDVPHHLQR